MDLTQLANLGEFIGGVAVLVTLIYLAVQVRHVQQMNRVAAADKNADLWFDVCNSVLDHYELWCRGSIGEGLSPKEAMKFGFLMAEVLGYLENFHTKFRQGVIDQAEWDRQQKVLRFYLGWPGAQAWWKNSEGIFGRPFVQAVNATIAGFEDGTIPLPEISLSDEVSPSHQPFGKV